MNQDKIINIATGHSAKSRIWKNKKIKWSDLVIRLNEENKTNETFKEFIKATKEEQTKIKDVGGYVGGYLSAGRRKPENVVHRQLLTLDIDFASLDFWEVFCLQFDISAVIHSTHKHCDSSPRYRLIIPLSREATSTEYVAVARRIAGGLNIELFDNTTFEPNRLMFWPSTPKDSKYYFEEQKGPWLDVDEVLNSYLDWQDSSLWPTAAKKFQEIKDQSKKQEDPEEKRGIVGAFCRSYNIEDAINTFLTEEYVSAGEGRYTYLKGTTAAGLIIYEDKFSYSHHGTDPTSGKLCNSFDLLRIHKFGHLEGKSFKAMEDFARKDKKVKKTIANENINSARYDFAEAVEENINVEWAEEMEVNAKGDYTSIASNINLILANDEKLKGKFRHNSFDNKRYVFSTLPWRIIKKPEPIKNVDFSGVRNYIESIYGISGNLKIDDSLALEFEKKSFNPVTEFLNSLKWDGIKRVDSLLVNYFGADNNIYTREAIRKMLVGAVARAYRPGIKFDLVLTIVGVQGTGKSTFIKKLGKDWFSDTFMTVHGKEALEQIQGVWLVEMAELAGLRKAEVESVKHFITKQEDTFRPAYGRVAETYKRQCVFFGTTNDKTFLKDPIGNRRFMPVDVMPDEVTKDLFSIEFDNSIDQIWAEAVELYKAGEKLFLGKEAEVIANKERGLHSENDDRKGLIEMYLDTYTPQSWKALDIDARRMYLETAEEDFLDGELKEFVCIAEIWCECLGKERSEVTRYNTKDINEIMRSLKGWEESRSTKNFGYYGKQKYYKRLKT
jgi:predicted P-loop ATPase